MWLNRPDLTDFSKYKIAKSITITEYMAVLFQTKNVSKVFKLILIEITNNKNRTLNLFYNLVLCGLNKTV